MMKKLLALRTWVIQQRHRVLKNTMMLVSNSILIMLEKCKLKKQHKNVAKDMYNMFFLACLQCNNMQGCFLIFQGDTEEANSGLNDEEEEESDYADNQLKAKYVPDSGELVYHVLLVSEKLYKDNLNFSINYR